jgi:hypothetical protein
MRKISLLIASCCLVLSATAQYAPQAGVSGSDAIAATSSQIVNWATGCTLHRGYLNIAQPSLGVVGSGDSTLAIGAADSYVVSLGDSGVATLTFATPIINGSGPDFAVFENGFLNVQNPEEAFLELAFVEVSSDGVNFFRFPASSLLQDTAQLSSTAGENYMNAREVNNLAGKYISNYGTPFDLEELTGIAGLDVNHITHVRLIDVIGSIDAHSSYDAANHVINDPYPTQFPTGGFDLDAVGVIHQGPATLTELDKPSVAVYPNPATDFIQVASEEKLTVSLSDITGKVLQQMTIDGRGTIAVSQLEHGVYFLRFKNDNGQQWVRRILKN